jgi:hypothetical protein
VRGGGRDKTIGTGDEFSKVSGYKVNIHTLATVKWKTKI